MQNWCKKIWQVLVQYSISWGRRQDSDGKSRSGSSTLTSRGIVIAKELWSSESEGIREKVCSLGQRNNFS